MKETLAVITKVRFFHGDKKMRAKYLRSFGGRWESDSHFVRSAVQYFMKYLDQELTVKKLERKVRR